MKTNLEFWVLSFSLIVLRMIDGYLTYAITPDLSFEANPLVVLVNQGWDILFFVNLCVILLTIVLLYFSIHFPADSYPIERNYSFKEFISYYLYNDKVSFHKIYFFVPYNKKTILNFCGFLFSRVFIFWSLIVITHNLGILHCSTYQYYLLYWNLWIFIYFSLIPLTLYVFWKFFRQEYLKYLSLTNVNST